MNNGTDATWSLLQQLQPGIHTFKVKATNSAQRDQLAIIITEL